MEVAEEILQVEVVEEVEAVARWLVGSHNISLPSFVSRHCPPLKYVRVMLTADQ